MVTGQVSSRRRYLERYNWRKEHNICTRCGLRSSIENKTKCKECNDQENLRKNEKTKCKYFKRNGLIKNNQNILYPSM